MSNFKYILLILGVVILMTAPLVPTHTFVLWQRVAMLGFWWVTIIGVLVIALQAMTPKRKPGLHEGLADGSGMEHDVMDNVSSVVIRPNMNHRLQLHIVKLFGNQKEQTIYVDWPEYYWRNPERQEYLEIMLYPINSIVKFDAERIRWEGGFIPAFLANTVSILHVWPSDDDYTHVRVLSLNMQ